MSSDKEQKSRAVCDLTASNASQAHRFDSLDFAGAQLHLEAEHRPRVVLRALRFRAISPYEDVEGVGRLSSQRQVQIACACERVSLISSTCADATPLTSRRFREALDVGAAFVVEHVLKGVLGEQQSRRHVPAASALPLWQPDVAVRHAGVAVKAALSTACFVQRVGSNGSLPAVL